MNEPRTHEPLPHSLEVWDNRARLSIPPGLTVWLGFLVATFVTSTAFVADHRPARWVLGGFVVSHLIVIALSVAKSFTLRVGAVSLTHVVCWSPGLVLAILDARSRGAGTYYHYWLYAIVVVISISFLFDLRDAGKYVYCLAAGKLPSGVRSGTPPIDPAPNPAGRTTKEPSTPRRT